VTRLGSFASRQIYAAGCWLARHRQSFRGRWRLIRALERNIGVAQGLKPAVRSVGNGYRLYIDPRDYNGIHYLLRGISHREPIAAFFFAYLRSGDNVLDIGANVGYYTALGSQLVGKTGRVLSFEASPTIVERLKATLRNPNGNVSIFDLAVSDRAGHVTFYTECNGHTGRSSMLAHVRDESTPSIVRAIALDDMLAHIPSIALVKIDVEGAEMRALRGMRALLARDRPLVVVELTDAWLRADGSSAVEVLHWMAEFGYRAHSIDRHLGKFVLRPDRPQQDVAFVHESDPRLPQLRSKLSAMPI
jgi:FkbM family methyltransferase